MCDAAAVVVVLSIVKNAQRGKKKNSTKNQTKKKTANFIVTLVADSATAQESEAPNCRNSCPVSNCNVEPNKLMDADKTRAVVAG